MDVVVIGAGIGGLANAIATVDAGGEVLVADAAPAFRAGQAAVAVRERVEARQGWLVHDTLDLETTEYFAAVSEGILGSARPVDESVPRRSARNLSRDEAYGRVETFMGSRLNAWAEQCVVSPYGLMYTSMTDWRTTTMKSDDGQSIQAVSVGTMEWSDDFGPGALRQWIMAEALERDIEVEAASTLEKLVFEEGVIVGVVLTTPDGPYAVRARAGVTIAPSDLDQDADEQVGPTPGDRLHVCLVGRTASRFGRVELMATEPAAPSRPVCTGSRRQLRDGLHDARQPALEGWRCGKVHGHPAFGQ